MAIGHTRYSTTGDSALLNAQPIRVDSTKGLIAIAHNGNLVNLGNLRARLEREGAYFQTTSDSEIIVQLIAHSRAGTLVDAIADSLGQVEGAFSIVMMTRDRIFAARDPRGFRPLSMGRIKNPDGPDTIVFASETCAFDLLRAEHERDVLPGELVMVTEDGVPAGSTPPARLNRAASSNMFTLRGPTAGSLAAGSRRPRPDGSPAGAGVGTCDADLVVPVPDSGVTAAIGYAAESRHSVSLRVRSAIITLGERSLSRQIARARLWGEAQAEPGAQFAGGTADHPDRRFHHPGHDEPEDCAHGAAVLGLRRCICASAPADHFALLLRRRHAGKPELIAANKTIEEIRRYIEADSSHICPSRAY